MKQLLRQLKRKFVTHQIADSVEIETITTCNRKCQTCPNAIHDRGPHKMRRATFYKIIDQLAELKFSGRLSPHFYGEPLLDERLPQFMQYARWKLPKAQLMIYTNGDFLHYTTYLTFREAGVDRFIVTLYDEGSQLIWKTRFEKWPEMQAGIIFKTLTKGTQLTNRGGSLPEIYRIQGVQNATCLLPYRSIVIDWRGNVVLCCNDYFSSVIFGNVNTERLAVIRARQQSTIQQLLQGEFEHPVCQQCRFYERNFSLLKRNGGGG